MPSNNERQSRFKQTRRDAGLERLELWLHPEDKIKVKALADKLTAKRGMK